MARAELSISRPSEQLLNVFKEGHQPSEPLMSTNFPTLSWQKVGTDTVYVVYLVVTLIWRFGKIFIGSPNLNHAVLTHTHKMN